jgi:hypothetical protein
MKSAKAPSQIEPLESRIAPATLILVGAAHGTPGQTDFDTTTAPVAGAPIFHLTGTSGSAFADGVDTTAVGGNADTYYIKLTAGDDLQQYNAGFNSLITVTKGTVVAFFVDANENHVVDPGELTGLSLGNGAALSLGSNLNGSILTNYLDKTNTVAMDNLGGPKQSIAGLTVGGQITGGVFAGGNINNLSDTSGDVAKILTGGAANGVTFQLLGNLAAGPGNANGNGTLAIAPAVGETGGSISNVVVKSLTLLQTGTGGLGGKGGSVSNITVELDTDGFAIEAGNGGAGLAGKSGGIGGSVSNVFVSGASDSTANSTIQILAGSGGTTPSGGKGGAGGALSGVYVGYDSVSGKPQASAGLLLDNVEVAAGNGGDGKTGGLGGALSKVQVLVQTQLAAVPIAHEIDIHAGNGGAPDDLSGGAAGVGGSATSVSVNDQNFNVASAANVLVAGGLGGVPAVANPLAKGGNGGSVSAVSFLGYNADILAGNGSDGAVGGKGGSVTGVTLVPQDAIVANSININSGKGGDGKNGNGGGGGSVSNINAADSDLSAFNINAGTAGNGGASSNGKGGDGGSVSNLNIIDTPVPLGPALSGIFAVRSGKGGDGDKGGGKGGAITGGSFFGQDLEVDFTAGDGGAALLNGKGGDGGKASALNLTSTGFYNGLYVNGTLHSGSGGAGAGTGAGGKAGDVSVVNLDVDGNVDVEAGTGGSGALLLAVPVAAGGSGGNINAVGAFGHFGSGTLIAGSAGAGVKAAKGGSIFGTSSQVSGLRAVDSLTIKAGTGSGGGDGGSISNVAFGSTSDSLSPTPDGNILVQAGDGSAAGTLAGKGGSVSQVTGSPSSGANSLTQILGGQGASGAKKGGDGGSLSGITISGAGDDAGTEPNPVAIIFQAGDAGSTVAGSTGGKGGNVTNVYVNNLDPDAVVRSVAAGNGGNADPVKGTGGLGGTIDGFRIIGGTDVNTGATLSADIGYRSGQNYGYTSMGGLFAGTGGTGFKAGLAGNVRNISADSIAAIVAGRDPAPQEVTKVEKITLNGQTALKTTTNSPFVITYNGSTTAPLDTTDPRVIQAAIEALPGAPANVTVIHTSGSTFQITNNANGDIGDYTAQEYVPGNTTENVAGEQIYSTKETIAGSPTNPETQNYKPLTSGTYTLTFGVDSTSFNSGDSASTIATQLNALPSISAAGGVAVTGDPTNGFSIKFGNNGDQSAITVDALVQEKQTIDVLGSAATVPVATTTFQITSPAAGAPTGQPLKVDATPQQVQDYINNQLFGAPTVTVAANPANPSSYVVTFISTGAQSLLAATEFIDMAHTNLQQGTPTTPEVQGLSFVPRPTFDPASYAKANLVGAIVIPDAIGSPTFKFTPVGPAHVGFQLGDLPTDGLIVAKDLETAQINFTPEAEYVTMLNGKVPQTPAVEKIIGKTGINEVQEYTVDTTGTYALAFGKNTTGYLPIEATAALAATDVTNALNGLASIIAAGGVTVTAMDNGAIRTFDVTFTKTGHMMPVSFLSPPFFDNDNQL